MSSKYKILKIQLFAVDEVQKQQILMQKTQQFIKSVKGVTVTRVKQQIFFYQRAQPNDCRYYGAPLQGNLPYIMSNRYHSSSSQKCPC